MLQLSNWPESYYNFEMIKRGQLNDEQLLDGVAMTTSISCSAQEFIDQYDISQESNADLSDELQISFTDASQDRIQINKRKKPLLFQKSALTETIKTKSRVKSSNVMYVSNNAKTNTKKTWEAIFELDDKLFQIHYLGLLENTQNIVDKINQIIITQQYSKLKLFEKQLIQIIKQIQFGLNQYQKQKKSFINQIQLLKTDNHHLNCTINELHTVIEQLQIAVNNHFNDHQLNPYINNVLKDSKEEMVPFARMFSHSLEEINLIKVIQDQHYQKFIDISQFSSFVLDLKKESQQLLFCNNTPYLKQNSLFKSFSNNTTLKEWMNEIIDNFQKISTLNKKKQQYIAFGQRKQKIIDIFLNKLSRNRDMFLKNAESSPGKKQYIWHIIHTSLITFLGILIQQTEMCYLQLSFGDHTNIWIDIFTNEIKILIQQSAVRFNSEEERYFNRILRMTKDVNSLVIFRMLRNGY